MDFTDLAERVGPQWPERPDGVVLEGALSSRAYGLPWEGDETSRLGVFLAPSEEFFGLDDVQETADSPYEHETLHELGKFVRLALRAHPSVLDLLWLDDYEICSWVGLDLIGLRLDVLSATRVRASYLHGAAGLAKDAQRGGARGARLARQMMRMLVTGFDLWSTGTLQVRLADPDMVHRFGERVGSGEPELADQMLAAYGRLFDETPTVLPDQPDRERVDEWLKATRRATLEGVNFG